MTFLFPTQFVLMHINKTGLKKVQFFKIERGNKHLLTECVVPVPLARYLTPVISLVSIGLQSIIKHIKLT